MRGISTKTLYDKVYQCFKFDGVYLDVFGDVSRGGIWTLYGDEKNGKTTLAVQLADCFSKHEKVCYLSAEQGTDKEFRDTLKKAGVDFKNTNIIWYEYEPIDELRNYLSKRQSPKICFIDNATTYIDDLVYGQLRKLVKDYPKVTFILVAHMEKGEPATAPAKLAKKISKIIIKVVGLTAIVSGRCPGGTLIINEQKAMLIHGSKIKKQL